MFRNPRSFHRLLRLVMGTTRILSVPMRRSISCNAAEKIYLTSYNTQLRKILGTASLGLAILAADYVFNGILL